MTRFILEELEEYGASYAEEYEVLEGAKRFLDGCDPSLISHYVKKMNLGGF